MALAKIVGFDVTPRMPRSTRRCSSPLVRYARFRLSSQGLCCWSSYSCCSFVFAMVSLSPCPPFPGGNGIGSVLVLFLEIVEQLACAGGHVVRREPELLEHLLV